MNLTDEELNVAIAEAVGWTRMEKGMSGNSIASDWILSGTPPCDKGKPEDDQSFLPIPRYTASLDACAEVEKRFGDTSHDAHRYLEALMEVVRKDEPDPESNVAAVFYLTTATPRQRAEALYLALKP